MINYIENFYKKIIIFLTISLTIFLIILSILVITIFSLTYQNLKKISDIYIFNFNDSLYRLKKSIDDNIGYYPFISSFKIDINGYIFDANHTFLNGLYLVNNPIFKKILNLKKNDYFLMLYNELSLQSNISLYIIIKKEMYFICKTIKPEDFIFNYQKDFDLLITDKNNVCLFSNNKKYIGEIVKFNLFFIMDNNIYISFKRELKNTDKLNYIIIRSVTKESISFIIVIIFLIVIYIVNNKIKSKYRNEIITLKNELTRLSNIINNISFFINLKNFNFEKDNIEDYIYPIEKYILNIENNKFEYKENNEFMNILLFLINNLINLLKIINSEFNRRKLMELDLKKSIQEKDILLKEVHHRVKNNLQIISSLLNLQMKYVSDEKDLILFKQIQNRIKSLALIYEKIHNSKKINEINFSEYIKNLTNLLFYSFKNIYNIKIIINTNDIFLDIDRSITCGLLITEIVENSFKYAFNSKSENNYIKIEFNKENDYYILIIEDNGIGIPENFYEKITETLGFTLITNFVSQLKGEYELVKKNGTRFIIKFPG